MGTCVAKYDLRMLLLLVLFVIPVVEAGRESLFNLFSTSNITGLTAAAAAEAHAYSTWNKSSSTFAQMTSSSHIALADEDFSSPRDNKCDCEDLQEKGALEKFHEDLREQAESFGGANIMENAAKMFDWWFWQERAQMAAEVDYRSDGWWGIATHTKGRDQPDSHKTSVVDCAWIQMTCCKLPMVNEARKTKFVNYFVRDFKNKPLDESKTFQDDCLNPQRLDPGLGLKGPPAPGSSAPGSGAPGSGGAKKAAGAKKEAPPPAAEGAPEPPPRGKPPPAKEEEKDATAPRRPRRPPPKPKKSA